MVLLDDLIKRFSETTKVFPSSQLLESAIAKAHADMSRRAKGHKSEFQVESIKWLTQPFLLFRNDADFPLIRRHQTHSCREAHQNMIHVSRLYPCQQIFV